MPRRCPGLPLSNFALSLVMMSWVPLAAACDDDANAPRDTADSSQDGEPGDGSDTQVAVPDAQSDVGEDVLEPGVGPWSHCPAGRDTTVGEGGFELRVLEGARYCRRYPEQQALTTELERKLQLHVVRSVHQLPLASGTYAFTLPVCGLTVDGQALAPSGEGAVEVRRDESLPQFEVIRYAFEQPLADASGAPWTMRGELGFEAYLPDGEVLPERYALGPDDASISRTDAFALLTFSLCPGASCGSGDGVAYFNSCTLANSRNVRTTRIEFEGGFLETELRIGESAAATEPASLVSARGELDGTAFEVDDYFQLVYVPHHHHFQMDYAVLFDAPLGEHCGLRARDVDGLTSVPGPATLATIDCGLVDLEPRAIASITTDKGTP